MKEYLNALKSNLSRLALSDYIHLPQVNKVLYSEVIVGYLLFSNKV